MKIYAVSLLAFSSMENADDSPNADGTYGGPPGTYSECGPGLIFAATIEEAAERARIQSMERWKPEDGWHTHQVNIMPVTRAFYEGAFKAALAKVLDLSDEPGQTFTWKSGILECSQSIGVQRRRKSDASDTTMGTPAGRVGRGV